MTRWFHHILLTSYYGYRLGAEVCVSWPMPTITQGLWLILITMLLGCTGWGSRGEPPEVLITDLTTLDSTAFEQRLRLDVRVRNPNDYDLRVTGVDFRVDLNGQRFARGLGSKEFTVPRLGEAVISIDTSTSMLDIVRQVLAFRQGQELTYGISGVLYLKDGHLPFRNDGRLLEHGAFTGLSSPPESSQ